MKKLLLSFAGALLCSVASAQTDPVVMTIDGVPVLRSEFEYSYNKNNAPGVAEPKTVADYVPLFVNYKLKVVAALRARLDTLLSFKQELASYRDKAARDAFLTDADVEREARRLYEEARQRVTANGGLRKVAHILVRMPQQTTGDAMLRAKNRIDSLYNVLEKGGDFATLARRFSDDPGTKGNGGELEWIEKGQTLPEFESEVWRLQPGQMSKPFKTVAGWHIALLKEQTDFLPFEQVKNNIVAFIENRGLREKLIDARLDTLVKESPQQVNRETLIAEKRQALENADPAVKYLNQEYHDGLLVFEMSNRTVWQKAEKDEEGLQRFFKKNKKKYRWDNPHFKGAVIEAKSKESLEKARKALKKASPENWESVLTGLFGAQQQEVSLTRGLFEQGTNDVVDRLVYKKKPTQPVKDKATFVGVVGKNLKTKPRTLDDVRSDVLADYKEHLEQLWVEQLRKQYPVVIDKDVLSTINKH